MRRGFAVLALAVPLVAGLIGSAGVAQARPLPPADVMQGLLLSKEDMAKAAGYAGMLDDAGGISCNDTPDQGRDCVNGAQPGDWDDPATYPSMVVITGFPTKSAASKHWRSHNLKPQPWSGETITIVAKTSRLITYTATPASPDQMAWAWTSIRGKQGIMMAQCTGNVAGAELAKIAECSRKVATAQAKKVKDHRPRTSLA